MTMCRSGTLQFLCDCRSSRKRDHRSWRPSCRDPEDSALSGELNFLGTSSSVWRITIEPKWNRADIATQRARVKSWTTVYPISVRDLGDSIGRPPQHTFFYPEEEYEGEHLDQLAELCGRGYGAVEVHLHHDGDTSDELRSKLITFRDKLVLHGLLQKSRDGRVTYGFIHGNWALDNSHPKGAHCGVNDEITILRETGCYADFTMPSAPAYCQTKTVNSLYYAIDDPNRPKSHDRGAKAKVGVPAPADSLLMIQGPLLADWTRRKLGFLPGLENGELHSAWPPTLQRFELWLQAAPHVIARPDWLFVKLHTHGPRNATLRCCLAHRCGVSTNHSQGGQSSTQPANTTM